MTLIEKMKAIEFAAWVQNGLLLAIAIAGFWIALALTLEYLMIRKERRRE